MMEQWDFLIQREGDRVWLPLGEGQTRLTPGRYRVVARTSATEAVTEVCVRYEPPSESKGTGQFYRTTRQTDEDGTILVLPATDLSVGIWSLSCSMAALRRDRPDDPPQGQVRLRVEAAAVDLPDSPPSASPVPESPQPPVTPVANATAPTGEPDRQDLRQDLDLRLQLAQDNYRLPDREALVLSGHIDCLSGHGAILSGLHLRIRLREPQSLHVVAALQRLLPRQEAPLEFSYPVTIPESCQSRLILGEVVLCDAVPTVLAKQSFVVTAGLETLLSELADGQIDRSLIERSQPQSRQRSRSLNPQNGDSLPAATDHNPQQQPALPPRLNLGRSPAKKSLDLPSFGNPLPQPVENPFGELQQPSSPPSSPELPQQTPLSPAPIAPELGDDLPADAPWTSEMTSSPTSEEETDQTSESESAIAPSLEGGLAPSRFSSRLNDIAHNDDLSDWLNARAQQANDGNPFSLGDEFESSLEEASEVVVDDEPGEPPPSVAKLAATPPPQQPVPTPELIVPTHTLAVGRPALIRVRLKQTPQRVYVKLWIHDRQNQLLLDGPRWLTDFFPVDDDLLESMIRLTIPQGGVELQFEAIAVDMDYERESYKVAIARRVSPPGLPSLPLSSQSDP
ncbi:MAG: hypothetical protein ACLFM4_04780 [Phormidium sp.]